MSVTISGSQQTLLNQGHISPLFLVTMTSASGTLRFCNNRSVKYLGNTYQPYLTGIGTHQTAANYPENNTRNKELQLQFENSTITLNDIDYTHLSQTFEAFDWELADCDVDILLTTSGQQIFGEDIAMPLVKSGTLGSPQSVDRQKFIAPVTTRNIKLNDLIPLRPVTTDDFSEADPDELNGRTYIPIVIGEDVRVRAIATTAGATTSVRTEVSTGTTLNVSDTTGFSNGDGIIIAGFTGTTFTIGTVDSGNNRFTGLSPNLSTLGTTIGVGDVVREDKATYSYTIADHTCGSISQVFVDGVLIDSGKYTKNNVLDNDAIDGVRTDVAINELTVFGAAGTGSVTQQPENEVPNGNHNHAVSVTQTTAVIHFANSTSPGGASAANDGNENTFFFQTTASAPTLVMQFTSFPSLNGTFVSQRYFAVAQSDFSTLNRTWDLRRGTTVTFLSVTMPFNKGEFRSTQDSGGSATTNMGSIVNSGGSSTVDLFEGWKEVKLNPSVSETTRNLTTVDRTQDVAINVTGANAEVGEKVEVVIDGLPSPDSARFGTGTITRSDYIMRWFLEEVLGQSSDIINLDSYSAAGTSFDSESFALKLAVQQPVKLDALFDQIAQQSKATHWWGRDGHNLKFLEDPDSVPASVAELVEDQQGVTDIDWRNSFSAGDIRNSLKAYFERDWTRTANRDESYTGLVEASDSPSQAKYGVLTNEISGTEKTFFYDFVTTEAHAQKVLDFTILNKKEPQKEITIQTDWTYINLAPGDIVELQSVTLNQNIKARVIENSIDPRLFCKIIVREIGPA